MSRARHTLIIAWMKHLVPTLLLFCIAGVAKAADAGVGNGGAGGQGGGVLPVLPPVPVATDWVPSLLLALVWLLVAAATLGPVVRYLRGEPRAGQMFSDDPPPRVS